MSIIIIAFPAAPKVDPECKRKDEELNRLLEQKVTGIYIFSCIFKHHVYLKEFFFDKNIIFNDSSHLCIFHFRYCQGKREWYWVPRSLSTVVRGRNSWFTTRRGIVFKVCSHLSKYLIIYNFKTYQSYHTFVVIMIFFFQKTMHRRGL